MNGSPGTGATLAVNGDMGALALDRAVGELRRGRAVRIVAGRGQSTEGRGESTEGRRESTEIVVAAVEAAQAPLLRRLEASGRELLLLLTAERAHAAELASPGSGPVAVALPAGTTPETLRALASVSPVRVEERDILRICDRPRIAPCATAGFQLAKAGRLLPALVGIESIGVVDASLLTIGAKDVGRDARFARHSLKRMSQSRVPLADALDCELALFRDEHGLGEHIAVIIGQPRLDSVVPVRLHSACLTGDLLGSLRCDCGEQLRTAVARIAALGGGVLLYLDQEGRGIGLANKLRAYALQDSGFDTIDADRHLGFHADERNYEVAVALLHELGVSRIELMTNNPQKIDALMAHGIEVVGRVPLVGKTNSYNERYLRTKRERAGHLAEEPGV
jgi:GTP cyclohydrolase II